jgi:hypothetical protein
MAEYRVPTQQELDRLLYMQGMQGKSNQQIIDENLARGSTIQSLPDNFFQTASAGARRVGDYVNQAGNVQQIVNKLFPSNIGNSQRQVPIPTSFNFAPKQAPTGEIIPSGLQTQSVPVANILQAIKPADVLGISGAERTYGALGAGKAPQPLDVVDTLGLGAGLTAAGRLTAKGGMATGRYIAPEFGNMAEQYAAKTGLLQSVKPIDAVQPQAGTGLLQTAPRSEIGFYSAVEQAAMASPRKSATGQAFLNDIMKGQDVRADEIKWMGLDDYLKNKQNVTKQEVQDYIANNRVNVQEVRSTIPRLPGEEMAGDQGSFLPKFAQYQLPGGENYRELVLTMPDKKTPLDDFLEKTDKLYGKNSSSRDWMSEDRATFEKLLEENVSKEKYISSHFPDQENPLAHIRVNDRVDADGKKMLLIEEVQSDWHQTGREKGYFTENLAKLDELNNYKKYLKNIYGRDPEYISVQERLKPEELAKFNELRRVAIIENKTGSVPDAPFKDTWYQLALKRAIQHAAENGYDRIGLTTGKQQAARFDLSKQIDAIKYNQMPDGRIFWTAEKNGQRVTGGDNAPNELDGVVGKEVAQKIRQGAESGKPGTLSGIDLQVGGEGMKKYYDEIYPKFLDKYGKKWGAKVGETSITTGRSNVGGVPSMYPDKEPIRYLDITPEMKAGVKKGQPLFAAVPAIPAAGLLAPQEKRR